MEQRVRIYAKHTGGQCRLPLFVSAVLAALAGAGGAEGRVISPRGWESPAIAAAFEEARAGDVVRLAAGTYTIQEAIRPKSRTHLLGAGQGKTVVRFGGERPGAMVDLGGCEDAEVANLTLDGGGSPYAHQGVSAGNARRLRIHHVTIRNLPKSGAFGPHGVLFMGTNPTREKGVTDSEVADCTLERIGVGASFGAGIRFSWGSSRNRALRNTIRETGRGGIFGDNGSTDLVIRGNVIAGSGGEGLGIEVWGGCDRSVIEDNRIDHWLSIGGCDYCAVRRNVISDRSGPIKFIGIEGIGSNCVITDNVVDDGAQIGLSVSGSDPKNTFFWGYNTVRRCVQWAAQFQGETGGITGHYLYRCRFLETTVERGNPGYPGHEGHGFRTNSDLRHLTFEECEFSGNARSGLQLGHGRVDSLSFRRCTVSGNGGPAVVGLGDDYTALEWAECTATGNAGNSLPAARPFAHAAPVAAFAVSPRPRAGQQVTFTSTSRAAAGRIATLLWDLGDGAPATGAQAAHTYPAPGVYRVTLVVWDEAGRGGRCEAKVRVTGASRLARPASQRRVAAPGE